MDSTVFKHFSKLRISRCLQKGLLFVAICATGTAANAQVAQNSSPPLQAQQSQQAIAAIGDNRQIQNVPPPTIIPTDIQPLAFGNEKALFSRELRFQLLKKLPDRLWFNSTTEASQRLETNVFFTNRNYRQDYVFRALPNVTLGWDLWKHINIYCNWFLIKDVFADHTILSQPTTQSLALGFQRSWLVKNKTTVQLDFQSRELWQVQHLRQADLIPALNVTRILRPNMVLFGSALLQMRGKYYFTGPTREIDPFYTVGFLYRRGLWGFTATTTYVSNFRFSNAIPPISNQTIICDFELNRPVSKKNPSLVSFIRAEPVFNFASQDTPGLSGVDFRLFGGLRLFFAKNAYNASMERLRQQLMESEDNQPTENTPPSSWLPPADNLIQPIISPAPIAETPHAPIVI